MGALLQFACSACGYSANAQSDYGFAGIEYQPMTCPRCREVVSVPVHIAEGSHLTWMEGEEPPELNACPACHQSSELGPLPLPDADESKPHACPACGKHALIASPVGIWD